LLHLSWEINSFLFCQEVFRLFIKVIIVFTKFRHWAQFLVISIRSTYTYLNYVRYILKSVVWSVSDYVIMASQNHHWSSCPIGTRAIPM